MQHPTATYLSHRNNNKSTNKMPNRIKKKNTRIKNSNNNIVEHRKININNEKNKLHLHFKNIVAYERGAKKNINTFTFRLWFCDSIGTNEHTPIITNEQKRRKKNYLLLSTAEQQQ